MTQGSESVRFGKGTTDTVLHRFEQWARDAPEARAVVVGELTLAYGQLDARANQLAHHLLAAGLPSGGRVAIGTARQAELVVALLAVLKAGGAYVLIDVDRPRTGQRQLAAVEPFALLTDTAHLAALDNGSGLLVIRLDAEAAVIAGQPSDRPAVPPPTPATDGRTAAVVFTGAAEPRAVPIGHGRLLAAHDGWAEVARLTSEDLHLLTAGPDLTAFAAGWTRALCSGGALVLSEGAAWKPEDVAHTVFMKDVTVLHSDPAGALRLFTRDMPGGLAVEGRRSRPVPRLRSVRLLAVTGERLYLDEQQALQDRLGVGARVLNVYALTEAAGAGTYFELPQLQRPQEDPERISLLGVPFPGCEVHVLDGEIRLTPPDGGDAVPTGDLGRLRPDGLLEFGGRLRDRITRQDGRVLDPYVVESAIRTHPGFGTPVVAAVKSGEQERIAAYVVPPPEDPDRTGTTAEADLNALRRHLRERVPLSDNPTRLVRLRALPRTRTGREDREALPKPAQPGSPEQGSGKYGRSRPSKPAVPSAVGCLEACLMLPVAGFVLLLGYLLWPGSTDLTGVPNPWAFLFFVLYVFEAWAFVAGMAFLFVGRASVRRHSRGQSDGLIAAAHLAIAYLLIAWWPQDNFYRLAAKQDWPVQAALVYTFNIPLMIAAFVVVRFLSWTPAPAPDPHDES
ncbi:AMP-binding protein [Streptomyces sp. NPDC059874]|uniref:AMP-binding protein n=1 Tax=Streptomyces sp. NPDC059874 TaxID=3346983 RepID=UPI003666375F